MPSDGWAEPRRTAWSEGVHRLRAAATTEPGRLRIIGAALAALVVLFGVVAAWQVSDRQAAAGAVVDHSQPLSADAAHVYRSLADADTVASSGFLAGGDEPRSVRRRYEKDIRDASTLLAKAAANSEGSRTAQRQISTLNEELPRYTGLVEAARANNRQGLPLGGAYLRYANEQMRQELLPAARTLYEAETERLAADSADARSLPWFALAAGVAAVGGLLWAQRRDFLRTNRMVNPGLAGATAACAVLLLWLAAGHGLARSGLTEAEENGAHSLRVLNDARTGALQARGNENMTLVARGGGDARYETGYARQMRTLSGSERAGGGGSGDGGLLGDALRLADDSAGRAPVAGAQRHVEVWKQRHAQARTASDDGDYEAAVAKVIGGSGSTGESFDAVDAALEKASGHEQAQFEEAAGGGRAALTGLSVGAVALGIAGAAAAVTGMGRRLSEYR
ncbi:hypothetical protein [Streptomyces sp. HNM0574]|uniref:hypothetical protein n=1 Tax=Streptomyces sp. HNM0574 TaxID=2714954 RepID=UPI00146B6996|nr:hypothetical protein [Streptomyces sp. HNM0574]